MPQCDWVRLLVQNMWYWLAFGVMKGFAEQVEGASVGHGGEACIRLTAPSVVVGATLSPTQYGHLLHYDQDIHGMRGTSCAPEPVVLHQCPHLLCSASAAQHRRLNGGKPAQQAAGNQHTHRLRISNACLFSHTAAVARSWRAAA
jgi:hypothetical protein